MVFQIFQWNFTSRRVHVQADAPETPPLIGFVPVLDLAGLSHSLISVVSLVRPLSG